MTNRPDIQPRGLTKEQAADYCGVSYETYRQALRKGLVPDATLPGKKVDKVLLDQYLDKMSNITANDDFDKQFDQLAGE